MPGPGGGSHSGGFGGGSHGGSGGGLSSGSSYGKLLHFNPRTGTHYYRSRTFFVGMLGRLLAIALFFGFILFWAARPSLDHIRNGGGIHYSEEKFQAYADEQYAEIFGSYSGYEDNLLIVFLTNEEADGYYAIAWVGDNIRQEINDLFGNEETVLGQTMRRCVGSSYGDSLGTDLAAVMDTMTDEVLAVRGLRLPSFYDEERKWIRPEDICCAYNYTALPVDTGSASIALMNFTNRTEIPAAIVIAAEETVFETGVTTEDYMFVSVAAAFTVTVVFLFSHMVYRQIKTVRRERAEKAAHGIK